MTISDFLCGEIACSCGETIRLACPRGTKSPTHFKTWCETFGTVLEGMVDLVESTDPNFGHPAAGYPKPTYMSIDLIMTKSEAEREHNDE